MHMRFHRILIFMSIFGSVAPVLAQELSLPSPPAVNPAVDPTVEPAVAAPTTKPALAKSMSKAAVSPSNLEYKAELGFIRGTTTESLTVGQTATNNLMQLPFLSAEGLYHFSPNGSGSRSSHFAVGMNGRLGFYRPISGVSFSSTWKLGGDFNWLYAYFIDRTTSLSGFLGLEYEKFSQGSLYNSTTDYNGPLYARTNSAFWVKVGPRIKTYFLHSWQILSVAYLHSLSSSSSFPTAGTTMKSALSGYDLDVRFGAYRRAYVDLGYRHFSGTGDLALTSNQLLMALGWAFY